MNMRALFYSTLLAIPVLGACSFVLDFDDDENLPCPCDQDHVCLVAKDTCVRRGSVEPFKSCDLGAERPDDLCPTGLICESVNGIGRRCLPTCDVSNYATAKAEENLSFQCAVGTTCWESARGVGVCSEGVCSELRKDCPPGQACSTFNGAGVCFTTCKIFQTTPPPCAGGQICQVLGVGSVAACIPAGEGVVGSVCTDTDMCRAQDNAQRSLVCANPSESEQEVVFCRALCECPTGAACQATRCNSGSPCVPARTDVDLERDVDLGVCIE
jgi:hypothetical protein